MRSRRPAIRTALPLLVLALVSAGCGLGDSSAGGKDPGNGGLDGGSGSDAGSGSGDAGSGSGDAGTDGSLAVSVTPPTATVTVAHFSNFTALVSGTSNTAVVWSVDEAGGGTVSDGSYMAPFAPGIFHVRATSAADPTKSAAAEVTVVAAPAIERFEATSASVPPGGSTSLTAVFTGGTGFVSPDVGPVTTGWPVTVSPASSTTYTLTVTNAAGDFTTAQIPVSVGAAGPQIASFTASASSIAEGAQATLYPVFSGGAGSIAPGVGAVVSGQEVVVAPSATTTYTLTVTDSEDRQATAPLTITVIPEVPAGPGSTTPSGTLAAARLEPRALLLSGGDVLILGGGTSLVERWTSGAFAPAGTLNAPRTKAGAALLADGKVLVAGGEETAATGTAEVFDPAAGASSPSFALAAGRTEPVLTRLSDGRVLITGGAASAELWDPAAPTATATVADPVARVGHGAVLLADGRVLVCGGFGAGGAPLDAAEIFDPASNTFSPAAPLAQARARFGLVRLLDGRVLAVGGAGPDGPLATSEVFNPVSGTWSAGDTLAQARSAPAAVLLTSGEVLVAGGEGEQGRLASVEHRSPVDGWLPNRALSLPRAGHAAVRLADSRVLIAGGENASGALTQAELYDAQSTAGGSRGVPTEPGADAVLEVPGQVRIVVPGAAIASPGTLTLSAGASQPPLVPSVGRAAASWRIELSGQPSGQPLAAPATITFHADLSGLPAGSDPATSAWVVWWDARNGALVEEPCTIDPTAGTVTVSTLHFSAWWLYVLGEGDVEGVSPHFRFRFPTNLDMAAWGTNDVFTIMAKVRTTLENAYDAYAAAGFTAPSGKINVYLRKTDEAAYNPLTGNITITSAVYTSDMAVYEHELSHEVFHAFQNAQLNMFGMDSRRWFVEAAADYAADAIATKSGNMGKDIRANWPTLHLATVDGNHEYATAHFLKWLVTKKGKDFKTLQSAVFSAWLTTDHGEDAFADAVGGPFSQTLKEYVLWLWLDPASPLASKPITATQTNTLMPGAATAYFGAVPARFKPLSFALTASLAEGADAKLVWDPDYAPPATMRVLRGGVRSPDAETPAPNTFPKLSAGDVLLILVLEEYEQQVETTYTFGPPATLHELSGSVTGNLVEGTYGGGRATVTGTARITAPYGVEVVSLEQGTCGGSSSGHEPAACIAFHATLRSVDPTESVACTVTGYALSDPGWGSSGTDNWWVTGADTWFDGALIPFGDGGGSSTVPVTGGAATLWMPRVVHQQHYSADGLTLLSETFIPVTVGEVQLTLTAVP